MKKKKKLIQNEVIFLQAVFFVTTEHVCDIAERYISVSFYNTPTFPCLHLYIGRREYISTYERLAKWYSLTKEFNKQEKEKKRKKGSSL